MRERRRERGDLVDEESDGAQSSRRATRGYSDSPRPVDARTAPHAIIRGAPAPAPARKWPRMEAGGAAMVGDARISRTGDAEMEI